MSTPLAILADKLRAYECAEAFAKQTGHHDDENHADACHADLTYWSVVNGLSFSDDRLTIVEWARQRCEGRLVSPSNTEWKEAS